MGVPRYEIVRFGEVKPQSNLNYRYLRARGVLSNPKTAYRIRSIRLIPFSADNGGHFQPDIVALTEFLHNLPNAKYIRYLR
jgi:hypothetical protein